MNIFSEAKKLQKKHPNKSWQELVKQATKINGMATGTKKPAARKTTKRRAVSGTAPATRYVQVKSKSTTKRRNISGIIDQNMLLVAGGMAVTSAVIGAIEPFRSKLPTAAQKLVDPTLAVIGYAVGTKAKNPFLRGMGFGIMAVGVTKTTQLIMGMSSQSAAPVQVVPVPVKPANQTGVTPVNPNSYITASMAGIGQDFYMPLPNISGVGYIGSVDYTGGGNAYQQQEDMYAQANRPYLPLGA